MAGRPAASTIETLITQLVRWAKARDDVRALALVGSHARGTARADSDVDLLLLTDPPERLLRDARWPQELGAVARTALESWGRLTAVRVWYTDGSEVEFGIAAPEWATAPDPGTWRVVRGGLRVLADPDGLLARLSALGPAGVGLLAMRRYSLAYVRVFVRDWPRAIAFYTETLGIPVSYRNDELGWAQLDTGEAQLALERAESRGEEDDDEDLVGRFLGVSLAVSDVLGTYESLRRRGVEFLAPPERMPWGGILAHLRDPDGNVLTLLGNPPDAA